MTTNKSYLCVNDNNLLNTYKRIVKIACVGMVLITCSTLQAAETTISASILPDARSVKVGDVASAFAMIVNGSATETAVGCGISPVTTVPGDFIYQTTDTATNQLVGVSNTPADILPGSGQSFYLAFDPMHGEITSTNVVLMFDCENTEPAPVFPRLNTLHLVSSVEEVPDIIALTSDFVDVEGVLNQDGAFAVSSTNIGIASDITVTLDAGSLPVILSLCQTDPQSGSCLGDSDSLESSVTFNYGSNATATFAVIYTVIGDIPFDPVNNRISITFTDSDGVIRGLTSVSIASVLGN